MSFRQARRAVALGLALAAIVLRYWTIRIRGPLSLERRAVWLQSACQLVLRSLGIHYHVEGRPPTRGIVVANHLSYLDILIFSSTMPCFFVAKSEIENWPYFGRAARNGGSLFINRTSTASANKVATEIAERLALPVPVVFFPEGTSSDGSNVQRFHSWLFDPAIRARAPVTAAAVRYVVADGSHERDLCWFGDAPFLPHLWKTLGTEGFSAEVKFGESHIYPDRRTAARATRAEVTAMRSGALVMQ
jgi:1-acyl-sn-glycerol-3-phosphate acyltransferase